MMLRRQIRTGLVLCALLLSALLLRAEEPSLKAGSPAPKLSASKWLNGDAVMSLEKGKVYVVECWATWCGPCIGAIPHISELNTQYKDKGVVFIGMNVWEKNIEAVEPFVKKMGAKMNYRVAMDDQGQTAKNWLAAAGMNGIPCSFVVDQTSTIAWIGHPMEMAPVLKDVVAGTFDVKKHAARVAKRKDIEMRLQTAAERVNPDQFIAAADEMIAIEPDAAIQLNLSKGSILLQAKQYEKGYALLGLMGDSEIKDNAEALNAVAWMILSSPGIEKRDLDLALRMAERADHLTKHQDGRVLDTLAKAHFEKGNPVRAVELQTLALEKAKGSEYEAELTKTLEKYKEARLKALTPVPGAAPVAPVPPPAPAKK